jgi:glyoxylase-like metal-dependent hydrolase (beta-lactamase superfamily II)
MKVEQIYTGCLAQGAYYIVSENEAAIIDPLREVKPYLDRLEKDNVTLKYIFETHFHADFVSGHLDLSKKQELLLFTDLLLNLSLKLLLQKIIRFLK